MASICAPLTVLHSIKICCKAEDRLHICVTVRQQVILKLAVAELPFLAV